MDELEATQPEQVDRRDFLSRMSAAAMAGGLVVSYGSFVVIAGKYVYPAKGMKTGWMYVCQTKELSKGQTRAYETPTGVKVIIARQHDNDTVDDFKALSSICPHLGCKVHWEGQNERFFCPCHNGVFDASGKGTGGPPGDAAQNLPTYPLRISEGLLFIEVPLEGLS